MNPADVLIVTNIAGRGVDLGIDAIADMNGGMHVVLTFLPENERIQSQILGRTARKGKPGSGELILDVRDAGWDNDSQPPPQLFFSPDDFFETDVLEPAGAPSVNTLYIARDKGVKTTHTQLRDVTLPKIKKQRKYFLAFQTLHRSETVRARRLKFLERENSFQTSSRMFGDQFLAEHVGQMRTTAFEKEALDLLEKEALDAWATFLAVHDKKFDDPNEDALTSAFSELLQRVFGEDVGGGKQVIPETSATVNPPGEDLLHPEEVPPETSLRRPQGKSSDHAKPRFVFSAAGHELLGRLQLLAGKPDNAMEFFQEGWRLENGTNSAGAGVAEAESTPFLRSPSSPVAHIYAAVAVASSTSLLTRVNLNLCLAHLSAAEQILRNQLTTATTRPLVVQATHIAQASRERGVRVSYRTVQDLLDSALQQQAMDESRALEVLLANVQETQAALQARRGGGDHARPTAATGATLPSVYGASLGCRALTTHVVEVLRRPALPANVIAGRRLQGLDHVLVGPTLPHDFLGDGQRWNNIASFHQGQRIILNSTDFFSSSTASHAAVAARLLLFEDGYGAGLNGLHPVTHNNAGVGFSLAAPPTRSLAAKRLEEVAEGSVGSGSVESGTAITPPNDAVLAQMRFLLSNFRNFAAHLFLEFDIRQAQPLSQPHSRVPRDPYVDEPFIPKTLALKLQRWRDETERGVRQIVRELTNDGADAETLNGVLGTVLGQPNEENPRASSPARLILGEFLKQFVTKAAFVLQTSFQTQAASLAALLAESREGITGLLHKTRSFDAHALVDAETASTLVESVELLALSHTRVSSAGKTTGGSAEPVSESVWRALPEESETLKKLMLLSNTEEPDRLAATQYVRRMTDVFEFLVVQLLASLAKRERQITIASGSPFDRLAHALSGAENHLRDLREEEREERVAVWGENLRESVAQAKAAGEAVRNGIPSPRGSGGGGSSGGGPSPRGSGGGGSGGGGPPDSPGRVRGSPVDHCRSLWTAGQRQYGVLGPITRKQLDGEEEQASSSALPFFDPQNLDDVRVAKIEGDAKRRRAEALNILSSLPQNVVLRLFEKFGLSMEKVLPEAKPSVSPAVTMEELNILRADGLARVQDARDVIAHAHARLLAERHQTRVGMRLAETLHSLGRVPHNPRGLLGLASLKRHVPPRQLEILREEALFFWLNLSKQQREKLQTPVDWRALKHRSRAVALRAQQAAASNRIATPRAAPPSSELIIVSDTTSCEEKDSLSLLVRTLETASDDVDPLLSRNSSRNSRGTDSPQILDVFLRSVVALELRDVPSDGDCFFHAAGRAMGLLAAGDSRLISSADRETILALRGQVANELLSNPSRYESFLPVTEESSTDVLLRIVESVLQPGIWAEEPVLSAFANAFAMDVHVISITADEVRPSVLHFRPVETATRALLLAAYNNFHFTNLARVVRVGLP